MPWCSRGPATLVRGAMRVARSTVTRHMAYGMPLRQCWLAAGRLTKQPGLEQETHARLASMNDTSKGGGGSPMRRRSIHPGSGRRKAAPFPRGRVLRQEEAAAVKALLGYAPRER